MHRFVLCVVIVGAALAAFGPRDVQRWASSGPGAITVHVRVTGGCPCESQLPVTPATAVTHVVEALRAKAPVRLPRPLAIAVVVLFVGLVSRGVAGGFPLGPRQAGAAEAWRQRRLSRGPPTAPLSCA